MAKKEALKQVVIRIFESDYRALQVLAKEQCADFAYLARMHLRAGLRKKGTVQ